ncbi:MAG TPA: His/Gly/Thr/Pro-type tRNA ligase C-terminal domain-containing protein, partial [Flavobacteriales bacterium]|nr:His/Gly/Thr/Pro-type tRNA ligase C-terminal domain-containing protein [Flavobacteriales bacterium]
LYPDQAKLPKQFTYAEKRSIPYVAIVGGTELKENTVTLKRMGAGEKGESLSMEQVIERINNG